MEQFPIFLNMANFPCAVVGGGEVAYRKISALLKAKAQICVISPEVNADINTLIETKQIDWQQQNWQADSITGKRLVVAATDNNQVNKQIFEYCEANNILVNTVDQPDLCRYTTPSIVDRSPIVIAISSAGMSPVLARRIRAMIETALPQSLSGIAQYAGSIRSKIKSKLPTIDLRRLFWEKFFSSSIMSRFEQMADSEKTSLVDNLIQNTHEQGEVWLVGAGPGDPELITIKALQKLQLADVVVYDRLVSADIVNLARKDAEFICVGKQKSLHMKQQQEINQLLVDLAKQGKKVCRLKGGDPFIFGRGGEELETLVEQQIPFQVIPAVTAAAGCSSYAGIPLTHRDYARKVTFVTGQNSKAGDEPDWQSLIHPYHTLCIYMGLSKAQQVQENLIKHGMAADMPVAIVENGTTQHQRVVTGILSELGQLQQQHNIGSPALLIIGQVVKLHNSLDWFTPDRQENAGAFKNYLAEK
ncbi:siroheme synthase [Catenovulum agarivorans DS-2]|uniref:Siroheme synthase n=1 Tax=Catenovulum agarivorans DS-2 TaxID=1328313 RepID=W7QET1_9ALTE|nr:siroheme synthase CysG [Catenovulum agarivorans]EWH10431.1 siroheme synthase [Catenovulum agarivorans DS-2]